MYPSRDEGGAMLHQRMMDLLSGRVAVAAVFIFVLIVVFYNL